VDISSWRLYAQVEGERRLAFTFEPGAPPCSRLRAHYMAAWLQMRALPRPLIAADSQA